MAQRPRMPAGAYEVIAGIVRKIADPVMRKSVADHFAREFHARAPDYFDAYQWERATGGKVHRPSDSETRG
jgi:hypothetical protein